MKSTSILTTSLALVVCTTAAAAWADDAAPSDSWSANIALTSDYRFRGISQAQRDAAVSGGLDYASTGGFVAGIWASNVDFNDAADTGVEVDLYAGYTKSFGENTSATVKAVYYWYPDADYPPGGNENDYFEVIASLSHNFGPATGSLEVAWSPDFFFESGDAVAVTGGLTVPIADAFLFFDGGVWASGKVGYQAIDDNLTFGTDDYVYYDVGVSAKVGPLTLDARWVDTDLDRGECFGGLDLCEGGFVATATLSFAL